MSFGSFFRNLGRRTTDGIVGVTSGSTPVSALDSSPRAYRLVVFLGIVAAVASGWLIYRNVRQTTALPVVATTNTVNSTTTSSELALLQNKDTDGDEISDYDELYTTHTSPYLKDSDGDGVTDSAEVTNQTDPNCPQGKVCEGFRLLTSIVDAQGNLTPEFLRQSLLSAGVPQAILDKTDDASLLNIYQRVIASQTDTTTNTAGTNINTAITNTAVANTNTSTSGLSLEDLQNFSPAEIRQLLIQNGIDETTLSSIDDNTLKQIFLESLTSNQ